MRTSRARQSFWHAIQRSLLRPVSRDEGRNALSRIWINARLIETVMITQLLVTLLLIEGDVRPQEYAIFPQGGR